MGVNGQSLVREKQTNCTTKGVQRTRLCVRHASSGLRELWNRKIDPRTVRGCGNSLQSTGKLSILRISGDFPLTCANSVPGI